MSSTIKVRKPVEVVEFIPPEYRGRNSNKVAAGKSFSSSSAGGANVGLSRKRPREMDSREAEKQAFLSGSVSMSTAASMGKIKAPRNRNSSTSNIGGAGSSSSSSSSSNGTKKNNDTDDFDLDKLFKSVERLGASGFEGKDKKIWEAKHLQSLGIESTYKIKMPFKMAQGVLKSKREKEKRAHEQAKLAGLVSGKIAKLSTLHEGRKKQRQDDRRKRYAAAGGDNDDDPTPGNIRNGVMYLGSKR